MKKRLRKGSYTIEAVVIMGITCMAIALILYAGSFWYGRACLTSSAYEMAFTGREQEVDSLWGMTSLERNCSFEDKKHEVSYTAVCKSAWGGFGQNIEIQAVVKKVEPVKFIRICKTLGKGPGEEKEENG